jgi:hypothetical protein
MMWLESPVIAYASRTGTKRNLAELRKHEWRLLVSATGCLRHEGFSYALDNGAWTAFQKQQPFDEVLFLKALAKLGRDADWVVVPDIVAGGRASLEFSLQWLPRVLGSTGRALIAVQDGMVKEDVADLIGEFCGIFVGGSTEWKEATIASWCELARSRGAWSHVGRVNTARRIQLCVSAGATSFDGTSASRFATTVPKLDRARRFNHGTQQIMFETETP